MQLRDVRLANNDVKDEEKEYQIKRWYTDVGIRGWNTARIVSRAAEPTNPTLSAQELCAPLSPPRALKISR